ncbi:hypothetical protein ABMA27_005547 [Loxostege sticticalis]|uniref:Uncharacterized protein n=1 Tax=Loxostege sticticalis TaxID=481309 RepID=A0ABR3HJK5_LOXSC
MSRPLATLLALAALAALVAADAPRPRLIDFNPFAWLPSNRNRSPSIMDYFFPPSRTPKQSSLDPPADRKPPPTVPETTLDNTPAPTTLEERSTTYSRKVSTKTKSTLPVTATSPPKTKKPSRKPIPVETTLEAKTTQTTKIEPPPPTVRVTTVPTTYRPTKHYSIRPVVRTETPTVQDIETTSSDSTETVSESETAGTTAEDAKETVPTLSTAEELRSTDAGLSTATVESTTPTDTTDAADSREGYLPLRDKPQQTHVKINDQTKKETVPLPAGSTSVLAKPTKYHYYPHNQHIYLLPECAIQQVCNAVYVRLNYTQPLCACPARYRDPCSASLNADDLHTTRLTTDSKKKVYAYKAVTLVKTCEAVSEMRECRAPRDWSLLALQNIRTGKSHYLVICRCPENHILEGPMSHDQPTYASVPGIRVYGMMCVRPSPNYHSGYNTNRFSNGGVQSTTSTYKVDYSQPHPYPEKPVYNRYHSYSEPSYYNRRSRLARSRRATSDYPPFPWYKVKELARSLHWID